MKREISSNLSVNYGQLTDKAKDFANGLTSHNVIEKDLNKQVQISQEHVDNNTAVRDITCLFYKKNVILNLVQDSSC